MAEQVQYPVRHTFVRTEEVFVEAERTDSENRQVIIVLDRPFETLSEELRGQLVDEYSPMLDGHWIEDGWSLSFVCEAAVPT